MPIIKIQDNLIYFAHIPKCAGQSIENYCRALGFPLAFLDEFHVIKPSKVPWNMTSPQHITGEALARLFPQDFFHTHFTVVRNPYERLKSAFLFQKHIQKKIKMEERFSDFVKKTLEPASKAGNTFDNHFLPQLSFLMPGAHVRFFKLEYGMEGIKQFINGFISTSSNQIEIGHVNKRIYPKADIDDISALDDDSLEIVMNVYKQDFIKFNYSFQI